MSSNFNNQSGLQVYKRLFMYVWPYKFRVIFAFLMLAGSSAAHAGISVVTYITMNGLINRDNVNFEGIPNLPPWLADLSFSAAYIPYIIIGVFLVRGILEYFSKYIMASTGLRAVMDVRNDLFKNMSYLSCDFYTDQRAGELISRIMNDVNNINSAITSVVADLIKSPLIILWSIPTIIFLGGKLALFCLAIFPVVVIPIAIIGSQIRRVTRKMLEKNADIVSFLQESILGIRVIKSFAMERREYQRFKKINRSVYDFCKKNIRLVEIQRPLIEGMGAIGIAVTISYAMKTLSADRFTAFAAALFLLYEPFKKISKINNVVQSSIASGARIFEIMDMPRTIKEKKDAIALTEDIDEIEFRDVCFEYQPNTPVLDHINVKVHKGEVIALVGPSGSGKTTFVNLLPRFYDIKSGELLVNGQNIKDLTLKSLRKQIGLVTQEIVLFSGTIAENIAYGRPGASRKDIIEAAKAAHADPFIQEFEKGYDTQVGERGMLLSGGQRQRLSIARAFLKNPPLLIFDEATSHLDTESEREVQAAIEKLILGRTVFVIAHRLSTIQNATRILVLESGKIIQSGNHAELLEGGGVYKRLYDLQFQQS